MNEKEEKTLLREREGVSYICSPVRHKSKQVGYAPRKKFYIDDENYEDALLSMAEDFGYHRVFSLADRQYDQDQKNAVRAKFTRDVVSASKAIKYLEQHGADDKGAEVLRLWQVEKLSLTDAVAKVMGIGENASADENQIHWDVLS